MGTGELKVNAQAPDFAQEDYAGQMLRLSDYQGQKNVVLVLNRGFF